MAEKIKGIGGWLLFFIIILVFIVPIYSLYYFWISFWEYSIFLGLIYTLMVYKIAISGWSIFIGISLWKKKPKAVVWAKEFLIVMLAVYIFLAVFGQLLPIYPFYDYYIFFPTDILIGLIFSTGGLFYLGNSIRVKNTFKDRELNRNRVLIISIGVIGLTFILIDVLIPLL